MTQPDLLRQAPAGAAMTGWPWLGAGWMVHCHAGQFPPGRIVFVPRRAGRSALAIANGREVLCRPQALDMRRMPALHWPMPTQNETSRTKIRGLEYGARS